MKEDTKQYIKFYFLEGKENTNQNDIEVTGQRPSGITVPEDAESFHIISRSLEDPVDSESNMVFVKDKFYSLTFYPGGERLSVEELPKDARVSNLLRVMMEKENIKEVVRSRFGIHHPYFRDRTIIL